MLVKKTGTSFGPPGKADLIYFIDDLNLPEVDQYDTQSAISLLRMVMQYGRWSHRIKLTWKNILNCQYLASMNPTAGSNFVNPRLQLRFVTFAMGFPGATSLLTIFQTFLDGHLTQFEEEIQGISVNIINATLDLHNGVCDNFKKSAINFHYEFNVRHLASVFQCLLSAKPDQFEEGPSKFIQLWLHEADRVYGDRLVSLEHVAKYNTVALNAVKKRFASEAGVISNYYIEDSSESLIFCHFAQSLQDNKYDQVQSMEILRKTLNTTLEEYNETNAVMNLGTFIVYYFIFFFFNGLQIISKK